MHSESTSGQSELRLATRQNLPIDPVAIPVSHYVLGLATFTLLLVFALMNAAPWVRGIDNRTGPVPPVVLLAFAWFAVSKAGGGIRESREAQPRVLAVIGIIATLGLLSAIWFSGNSWKAFFETIVLPLLTFAGVLSVRGVDLPRLGRCLNAVLFAVTTFQLLQYIRIVHFSGFSPRFIFANHYNVLLHNEFGRYSFGNSDNASVIFVTALAVALVSARGAPNHRMRLFAYLSALTAAGAVYITGSRGALISCLGAIVVAWWPATPARGRSRWGRSTALVILLTLAGLSVWSVLKLQPIHVAGTSLSVRQEAMAVGVGLIVSHPLVGFGPANVNDAVNAAAQNSLYSELAATPGSAYNLFLNWGIGTGALSMILVVFLTLGAIRRCARAGKLWAAAPLAAFTIAGSTVGSSLVGVGNYSWSFLFWVCLALAWRPGWAIDATNGRGMQQRLVRGSR